MKKISKETNRALKVFTESKCGALQNFQFQRLNHLHTIYHFKYAITCDICARNFIDIIVSTQHTLHQMCEIRTTA